MTYDYEIISTGEIVQVEQRISDKALTVLEHEGQVVSVRRLISSPGSFILKGGTWFRDGYERGIQSGPKDKK